MSEKETEIRITAEIYDAQHPSERFQLSENCTLRKLTFSECALILEHLHKLFQAIKQHKIVV